MQYLKSDIKYGVLQGVVFELLLCNIDLIDLFVQYKVDDITSYVDDTTPYSYAQDISSVISKLQRIVKKIGLV